MTYSIVSRMESDQYEYFHISGDNPSSFSIGIDNGAISTTGLEGAQNVFFTCADGTVTQPDTHDFTVGSTLNIIDK